MKKDKKIFFVSTCLLFTALTRLKRYLFTEKAMIMPKLGSEMLDGEKGARAPRLADNAESELSVINARPKTVVFA